MEQTTDTLLELADLTPITKWSKNTIERHIKEGKFPRPIKVGRNRHWSRLVIEEWFAEQRKQQQEATTTNNAALTLN